MPTTYVVLLPGDESGWEAATPERRAATYDRHGEFMKALADRGHTVTGGAELAHSRETKQVRLVDGEAVVTDGPYSETVEQLTGFYVVESDDLDDLLACAAMLADAEGPVEVRATVAGTDGPA